MSNEPDRLVTAPLYCIECRAFIGAISGRDLKLGRNEIAYVFCQQICPFVTEEYKDATSHCDPVANPTHA